MNRKISLILIILTFTLLANGCSTKISLTELKKESFTTYYNDNINIKISNKVKEKEKVHSTILENLQKINDFSPIYKIEIDVDVDEKYNIPQVEGVIKCNSNFIKTEEFKKELVKRSYDIYDNWISEGLYARIFKVNKKELDFSKYYKTHQFSLFGARFFGPFSSRDEIENIKAASVDLTEYLIKGGLKEELLKNQIRIEHIEKWAKNKNINLSYQKGIESLMNRMEVYKFNITTILTLNTKEDINGFTIDILTMDKQYDTAKKIEDFILMMDRNERNIKEGIRKDAPNFYKEYSVAIEKVPKIHYYLNINEKINITYIGSGVIYLRDLEAQAHEYNHILVNDSFRKNNINMNMPAWLDEAMGNYLDVRYSDSFRILLERMASAILDVKANEDKLSKEEKKYFDNVISIFKKNNIDLNDICKDIADKNTRVKLSIIECSLEDDMYKDEESEKVLLGSNLGKYGIVENPNAPGIFKGNYIGYWNNMSFSTYLFEKYGLEKLLYLMVQDCSTLTYEEYFGKSYEELKTDWKDYVKGILMVSN